MVTSLLIWYCTSHMCMAHSVEDEELDEYYEAARELVLKEGKASVTLLMRKLPIGYSRSARLIDQLERCGVISHQLPGGRRTVLQDVEDL